MYKLFTDKAELFECSISLQGASLKKSKARLVVETQDYSLLFNGSINSNGKCEIPIRKLKGLIDEDTSGNIRLEVIAEDTFFTPWESDFEVETSKKVTVEGKTQATQKPILEAKATVKPQQVTKSEKDHVVNLFKLLIKEDINIDNISYKRNKLNNTLQHSVIIGFDFYHYDKKFWLHSWGNLMPYHYDNGDEYSYHNFNGGQWLDYSGGLIFGYWFNKNLGAFIEGKYNKYWNREWHDFSVGVNYIIR